MGNEQKNNNDFNYRSDSLNEIKEIKNKKENKELKYNLISYISELCNSSLIDDNNLKVENNIACLFNPFMDIRNSDKLIGKKEETYLVESNLNYYTWFQNYNNIKNYEKIKSNIPFGLVENKINQFMKIIKEDKFDYHQGFKNLFPEEFIKKKSKSEEKILKEKKKIKNEIKDIKQNNNNNSTLQLIKLKNEYKNLKEKEIKNNINSSKNTINNHHKINKSNDTIRNKKRKKKIFNNENSLLQSNDNPFKNYNCKNQTIDDLKFSKNSISSILVKNYSISSQNSFANLFTPKIKQPSNLERSQFFVQEEISSYADIARKKFEMNKKNNLKKNLNNNNLYYKSNNNLSKTKEKNKKALKNSKSNENLIKKKKIDKLDIEKDIDKINYISKKLSIISENTDEGKVSNAKNMKEYNLNKYNPFKNFKLNENNNILPNNKNNNNNKYNNNEVLNNKNMNNNNNN